MRLKWTEEAVKAEAKKYSKRIDFERGSLGAYDAALKKFPHILQLVFGNPSQPYKWSKAKLKAEALKYKSKRAFELGSPSAYRAALAMKLFNEIKFPTGRFFWTEASIRDVAKDYKSKADLLLHKPNVVSAANRKFPNLLNSIYKTRSPASSNDVIYIWQALGEFFNGNPVFKIGVTSSRIGSRRLKECARASGFPLEVVCFVQVWGRASDVEKELLMLGEDPKYLKFDGSTEFRALTDSALSTALKIISTYSAALSRRTCRA